MSFKTIIVVILLSMLLSGCVTPAVDHNYEMGKNDDSVFVIGTNFDYDFIFKNGKIDDGYFVSHNTVAEAYSGKAINGYIVGRASPGKNIGLSFLDWGQKFHSELCGAGKTFAFNIPKGKVIYIGEIQKLRVEILPNSEVNGAIRDLEFSNNFDTAREYIDTNFPNLAGMEEWSPIILSPGPCINEITVPIYF